MGFGQGLMDMADAKRAEALEKLRHDRALEQYRKRAEIQEQFDIRAEGRAQARKDARRGQVANVYESLFGTESGGNFGAANSEGYMGRSQFGQARLDDWSQAIGTPRITPEQFRKNPALQKEIEKWHFQDINDFIDKNDLESKYAGKTIGGVKMSRSGMIAMAHLGGSGGMKKFLDTGGKYNPTDSNGTSLSGYARTHGGLSTDMSGVWDVIADEDIPAGIRSAVFDKATGRDKKKPKSKALSRSMTVQIQNWGEEQGMDQEIISSFIIEAERLKGLDMTENEAFDSVIQHFEVGSKREDIEGSWINKVTGGRIGRDPTSGTVSTGPTGGFNYPEDHPGYQQPSLPQGFNAATAPAPTPSAAPEVMSSGPSMSTPAAPVTGPAVGTIDGQYRFKGGNPNDQNNWERVS